MDRQKDICACFLPPPPLLRSRSLSNASIARRRARRPVCVWVGVRARARACVRACVRASVRACVRVYKCMYHTYVCTHVWMDGCMYVCVCVCMRVYVCIIHMCMPIYCVLISPPVIFCAANTLKKRFICMYICMYICM